MGGVRIYDYFADEVTDYKMKIVEKGNVKAFSKTCYDMYFVNMKAVNENCFEGWATNGNDVCFEGGITQRYDQETYTSNEIYMIYYFEGLERWGGSLWGISGVHHYFYNIPILNCLLGNAGNTCSKTPWFDYVEEIKAGYVGRDTPNERAKLIRGIDQNSRWSAWNGFIKDIDTWGWTYFAGLGAVYINCLFGSGYSRNGGHLVIQERIFLMGKESGIGTWDDSRLKTFYESNSMLASTSKPLTLLSPLEEKIHTKGNQDFRTGNISFRERTEYRAATTANADSIIGAGVGEIANGTDMEIIYHAPNRYNNCKNRLDSEKAPWIRLDIPDKYPYVSDTVVFTQVEGAMDFGIGPGALIDPQANSYHLWYLTPDPNGETEIFFRKKAIEKIVMAPYFVYIKEPKDTSSTSSEHEVKIYRCAVGEILKNLEPGVYYFPNPCYCLRAQKNMAFFGSEVETQGVSQNASKEIDYPVSDAREFFKYFPNTLPIYCKQSQTDNAIKTALFTILGTPWSTEIRDSLGNVTIIPSVKSINMEYSSEINPYVGLEYLIQSALAK